MEKSTKLIEIEKKAWTEFNINNRKRDSKVIDNLQNRWNKEFQKLTGKQNGFVYWTAKNQANQDYIYYFEDILA